MFGVAIIGALLLGLVTYSLTRKEGAEAVAPDTDLQSESATESGVGPTEEFQPTPGAVDFDALNPKWYGSWKVIRNPDTDYGTQKIDVDPESGFTFQGLDTDGTIYTIDAPFMSGNDHRSLPMYTKYTGEITSRDELVARAERALALPVGSVVTSRKYIEDALSHLPGTRFKVIARLTADDDECARKYILNKDVMLEFFDCGDVFQMSRFTRN